MISKKDRKEMLEDAASKVRRSNLSVGSEGSAKRPSFDEYLSFLEGVQKIFSPFKISTTPTATKFNRL